MDFFLFKLMCPVILEISFITYHFNQLRCISGKSSSRFSSWSLRTTLTSRPTFSWFSYVTWPTPSSSATFFSLRTLLTYQSQHNAHQLKRITSWCNSQELYTNIYDPFKRKVINSRRYSCSFLLLVGKEKGFLCGCGYIR